MNKRQKPANTDTPTTTKEQFFKVLKKVSRKTKSAAKHKNWQRGISGV